MPGDGFRLNIPYSTLSYSGGAKGIDGVIDSHSERAEVWFSDGQYQYMYSVDVTIFEPTNRNRGIPSLLGRQILNRWHITYDAQRPVLNIDQGILRDARFPP